AREAMRTRAQAASRARAARASRKATAKGANAAARRAASSAGRFARMAALQARAATAALTGLGSSAAAVVVVTCLAAFVATSAFGIFLMGGDIGDGNPPLREVVAEIDAEHAAKVEEAKASAECDEVSVSGGKSPWKETLAVFAVKLAADAENPLDVLTLDAARQGALRAVFWDMNSIETEIEEAEPSDSDGEDAPPAKVLRVTLSAKTAEQMASAYGFDAGQLETLRELLDERHDAAWRAVLHGIAGGAADIVEIASSQLGNVGGRPYWSWYGFESRVEWCACFVSWCANECGYIDSGAVPKFSYCPTGVQWFKAAGRWLPGGSAPAPGDIVFFDWDGDGVSDHVGIVESCDGSTVRTIEGNSDDACRRSAYGVGSPFIMGYGACSF
ncbi:MAG: CHAP domain-containing protein, partial [Adlercreutzia equolifaciens]